MFQVILSFRNDVFNVIQILCIEYPTFSLYLEFPTNFLIFHRDSLGKFARIWQMTERNVLITGIHCMTINDMIM